MLPRPPLKLRPPPPSAPNCVRHILRTVFFSSKRCVCHVNESAASLLTSVSLARCCAPTCAFPCALPVLVRQKESSCQWYIYNVEVNTPRSPCMTRDLPPQQRPRDASCPDNLLSSPPQHLTAKLPDAAAAAHALPTRRQEQLGASGIIYGAHPPVLRAHTRVARA